MAAEGADGPMQKKARMVAYPNFRPAGYDFDKAKDDLQDRGTGGYKKGHKDDPDEPSPVLHLRNVSSRVAEVDIWTDMEQHGTVVNVFMIKQAGQALVEFDSVGTASQIIDKSMLLPIKICGSPIQVSFSKSKKIATPVSKNEVPRADHNILLLSVHNVQFPITVDVIYSICKPYGEVARIVIFKKLGIQCMVEFIEKANAVKAKKHLNGTFIYANCCSLRVDYAKPDKLLVKVNNQDTWDFTAEGPSGGDKEDQPRVLLPNPMLPPHQQQQQQSPPWGPGWGMGMGWGMGKNDGMMGPGPGAENGSKHGGGWNNPPPPPPPEKDDGDSNSSAYGYNSSYQSGKYGSGTGFPDSYSGGYGEHASNSGGSNGEGGFSGYGNYPPNFAQMAMMASQAGNAMARGGNNEMPNCVLMLYGLSTKFNCDRLFNLVCLYGNVVRIKFLRTKKDAAMVQMEDPEGCVEAQRHLNALAVFDDHLRVTQSKQSFVLPDAQIGQLPDGSPASKDYIGNKCNRFLDPKGGALKRYPPNTILHYYNAPPGYNEDDLKQAIEEQGAVVPDVVKVLGSKNGKNSSGLLQWVKQSDANDAMCLCNHMKLEELASSITIARRPNSYTLKMCFSNVPLIA